MIPSRTVLAAAAALFCLVLGGFALARAPRERLNQWFALFTFTASPVYLPGPILLSAVVGHDVALVVYRLIQFGLPLSCCFFLCFLQELTGRYNRPDESKLRRFCFTAALLSFPIYLSPLVIRDFTIRMDGLDAVFLRERGILFLVSQLLFLLVGGSAVRTLARGYVGSLGVRRNQLRFVVLGMALGFAGFVSDTVASGRPSWSWTLFPLLMLMLFCYAYAIFKHNLFEFSLWMRRLSIYGGVYLTLAGLPLLMFFPFRELVLSNGSVAWGPLAVAVIGYGMLFSAAPFVSAELQRRSEQTRWRHLHEQLATVRLAAESLSGEAGASLTSISDAVVGALRQFYWERMGTPLQFIFVVLRDRNGVMSVGAVSSQMTQDEILNRFLSALEGVPPVLSAAPFGLSEVAHERGRARTPEERASLVTIDHYLHDNQIELCCPCLHDGHLYGAILLGSKTVGIFWPEETATLQITASHAATAVRKSELLVQNRALKDLDELKSELISNITHEFKAPLNVITNAIELLFDDIRDGEVDKAKLADYLVMIRNNAEKLAGFIQNLLEVARIEQARIDLRPIRTPLEPIIEEAIALLRPSADRKGLAIEFDADGLSRRALRLDAGKINQVATNLIGNAIKFTERGTIRVTLRALDNEVRLSVRDTGYGIDPRFLDAVFTKFFQVPSSRRADGAGLGLAIAKGWVEAHGGRIWAESDGIGKGTAFHVALPIISNP